MNKRISAAITVAGLMASAASATDFSYTGTFVNDNDKASFVFSVAGPSTVTLLTYSYAGGTNAAGATIARGGFDPILTLYDATGTRIGFNDDGGSPLVPTDSATNRAWDTYFQAALTAGSYRVFVTQYNNFGPAVLGPFPRDGDPNFRGGFVDVSGVTPGNQRDGHWAFDILNVDTAVQSSVPEPMTWAMMLVGFGAMGTVMRRRARVAVNFG